MSRLVVHRSVVFASLLLLLPSAGCSGASNTDLPDARFEIPDGSRRDAGTFVRPDAGPHDGGDLCGVEDCTNGLDDDCNGVIDCACRPTETRSCFGGTAATRGVGACHDGTMICGDGLEFGTWGDCAGDVLPAPAEVCDPVGVDENCNGAVNEGCDCHDGDPPVACGSDVGECAAGTQACVGGHLGECTGAVGPAAEICDGLDNDCDGMVDQSLSRPCGSDVGECRPGAQACIAGTWETCAGGQDPTPEVCDGLDNDCNGMTDESLTRACGSAVGACRAGMQSCGAGVWSTCAGETLPSVETCNNVDDDCDGMVDDGVTRACGSSAGICRPGTQTCTAGVFGTCAGGITPGVETCDGVLDENCDGTVDEGCGCVSGATRACGSSTGSCRPGSQTCTTGGMWGTCTGGVGPTPEVCNGADDDCDGMVDEGGICPTSPPIATCGAAVTARVLSTVTVSGTGSDPDGGAVTYRWTVLSRPTGSTSMPTAPTSATTTFYLDASGAFQLQLCVTDDEGVMACCTVNVTSTPPGAIHAELSWSTAYGDVDQHLLNVTRVADAGWFTTDDCYFANPAPDWAPAGAASNPTLDLDDTDGFGPENTTITLTPSTGTYTVGVHFYCSHSIGRTITPGDGPTVATVRVFCDGALIATYSGINLNRTDDWVTVASVDYPSCAGRSINRRSNGTSLLPAGLAARHCEINCAVDGDCPTGERCALVGGGGPPRYSCIRR